MKITLDKIATDIAYGTSDSSGIYWLLQLLEKISSTQGAVISVLSSLVFDLLTFLVNLHLKIKENNHKEVRGELCQ